MGGPAGETGGTAPRRIEYVPLSCVRRATRNAKTHDVDWIKQLISEFGFVGSAVHDGRTDRIIAGHGRLESLEQMAADGQHPPDGITLVGGGEWAMPVEYGWSSRSDAEAEALGVALNESTTRGGWDERVLAETLADLDRVDADLRRTAGWDDEAFADLVRGLPGEGDGGPGGDGDPDDVPEPPAEPVTKLGDLWLLGPHRVVCGDAVENNAAVAATGGNKYIDGVSDHRDQQEWRTLCLLASQAMLKVCEYVIVNIQMVRGNKRAFVELLGDWRDRIADIAVWAKTNPQPAMNEGVMSSAFEWLVFLSAEDNPGRRIKSATFYRGTLPNVYSAPSAGNQPFSDVHAATFPVHLPTWVIANFARTGQHVIDTFGGTGTTLIAAHQAGHAAAIVEIDPRYVDLICRRWQEHTDILPVNAETGEKVDFAGVSKARNGNNEAA